MAPELRNFYYRNLKDLYFPEKPVEEVGGAALIDQLFASLGPYINKIVDISIKLAEENISEGVLNKNEWSSDEYGRISALNILLGTNSQGINVAVSPMEVSFLPQDIELLPEMTNELSKAISIISGSRIDVGEALNISQFEESLLSWVNQERSNLGLTLYDDTDITQYCSDNGLSKETLYKAYHYMRAHMYLFPRLPSVDEQDVLYSEWKRPFVSTPVEFYTRDLPVGRHEIGPSDTPLRRHRGIQPKLSLLRQWIINGDFDLMPYTGDYTDVPDMELARRTENRLPSYLIDMKKAVERYIGEKRVRYDLSQHLGEYTLVALKILNQVEDKDGNKLDEIYRVYPIPEEQTTLQQSNYVCARLDNGTLPECTGFRGSIIEIPVEDCTLPDEPEEMCSVSSNIDLTGSKLWMMESRYINDENNAVWEPVGILNFEMHNNSLYWYYDENNPDMGAALSGRRFNRLTSPPPIGGRWRILIDDAA